MYQYIIIIIAFTLGCSAMASPLPDRPHIYVEGRAEIKVNPDLVTFTLLLNNVSKSADAAKILIDGKSVKLIKLCEDLGIKIEDVASTGLQINKEYEYDEGMDKRIHVGVSVSRSVRLVLRDINKYKLVLAELINLKVSEEISTRLSLSNES